MTSINTAGRSKKRGSKSEGPPLPSLFPKSFSVFVRMTVNKEEEKETEASAAVNVSASVDMPTDLPMYCVKTLQETSASVFRMVSCKFFEFFSHDVILFLFD